MPAPSPHIVRTTATYDGRLACTATHPDSGTTVRIAAPKDNQGDGSGFSPTDLLGVSMSTCMMTIMAIAAQRDGVELTGMRAEVDKQMSAEGPRRVARLTCRFTLPGSISDEELEKLKRAAETCPVKKSLHPDVEVILDYRRE